jgi:hypothetical protein
MEHEDISTAGVSRRSVLKKAAIGGAVVWAAPAITSLSAPAFAEGSPSCQEDICSKVIIPGGTTIFLRCHSSVPGCLCKCAGDPNSTCSAPDPCVVPIVCVIDPTCTF